MGSQISPMGLVTQQDVAIQPFPTPKLVSQQGTLHAPTQGPHACCLALTQLLAGLDTGTLQQQQKLQPQHHRLCSCSAAAHTPGVGSKMCSRYTSCNARVKIVRAQVHSFILPPIPDHSQTSPIQRPPPQGQQFNSMNVSTCCIFGWTR